MFLVKKKIVIATLLQNYTSMEPITINANSAFIQNFSEHTQLKCHDVVCGLIWHLLPKKRK